ncbi:MAG: hypothetical protein Fur0011_3110 [Candidatus Microgenomates bacterium]
MNQYDPLDRHESPQIAESTTPLLDNLITSVINSLDTRLRALAIHAFETRFYPEKGMSKSALAVNSFREQWQILEENDPDISERFRNWGIGCLIDSVKQKDINFATNHNIGDRYILNNLESVLSYAKHKNYDVILGRYSGDELIAFFIPKDGPVDPNTLNAEFITYNQAFLEKNTSLSVELNKVLPNLKKVHGNELKLGATIKSKRVSNLSLNNNENMRDRQLLTTLIDHIEGKYTEIPGYTQSSLCDSLIKSWQSPRKINDNKEIHKETSVFESILPTSILDLYHQAVNSGISPAIAATYAEEATFEDIYPRMSVYRLEVFPEIARQLAKKYGKVAIVKSGDPYIKWTNKYVSHYAGDQRMIQLAKEYPASYDASAQHHGSFLHLIKGSLIQQRLDNDRELVDHQPDNTLSLHNHNPKPFKVTTNFIYSDKEQKVLYITPNSTDQEILEYAKELSAQQTLNEIITLTERSGYSLVALKNLIRYLSVRINLLEEFTNIAKEIHSPKKVDRVANAVKRLSAQLPSY